MENKLDGASLDIEQMERERLKSVFPQCFIEGKLDIDKLLNLCGEYIDNDFEKYKFEWHGKGDALKLAQRRSMGTLRPCVEDSVAWDTTENLYIEGDNLEVLKLLQTAYYRRVKMIYIDPPYNTGNDFVYEDDFKDPINRYKEVTAQTTKSNPETMGRFHTNWLNMIYPRLRLAANLLTDDGVIFISIDDNEVHNLRKVCDEVFGEENFVAQICHKSRASISNDKIISSNHNHILLYAKNIELIFRTRASFGLKPNLDGFDKEDERGKYKLVPVDGPGGAKKGNPHYEFKGITGYWRFSKERMQTMYDNGYIVVTNNNLQQKYYLKDAEKSRRTDNTWWDEKLYTSSATIKLAQLMGGASFDTPKPVELVSRMLELSTKDDDIILDFFSGSGTTAHAVMQLNAEDGGNRKFICVQLPEVTDEKSEAYKAGYKNICEIGKERIRRAGVRVVSEQKSDLFDQDNKKLDTGFKVFKLDTSNLKTWDSTPINSSDTEQIDLFMERLNGMVETIKADRTQTDMVYEVMLKMGIPLTYSVTEVEIGGKRAYAVGDVCLLLVCLQEGLTTEIIETMASDYLPSKLVLSEKCFADDTAMANTHYILKEREIELKLV
ncbi:MAG: site-specific DNA-methyltransferase [Mucinivorans sp.]